MISSCPLRKHQRLPGGETGLHDFPHSDHGLFADLYRLPDFAVAADERACTDEHVSVDDCSRGNVTMISDLHIMLDRGSAVYDTIAPDRSACIDDRPMYYDRAFTQNGISRDMRGRGDDSL